MKVAKQETLETLLRAVDLAFGMDKKPAGNTFVYSLGPIYDGWRFNVTDNWYEWSAQGFKHDFYSYDAASCIRAFLTYIKKNKIKPAKLRWRE